METFRKRLRWFGTPCLLFSLSTALAEGNVNTLAPAPLPTISPAGQLEPPVADPYQQLSTQIVKNAKAQTGPKLMAGKDSYDAPTVWHSAEKRNLPARGLKARLRFAKPAAKGQAAPSECPDITRSTEFQA